MDQLDKLESILKKGYFILYQMSAAEYESRQININTASYLEQWIGQLKALEKLNLDLKGVSVPSEILKILDSNESPDLFYRKKLLEIMLMNQKSFGKVVSLKALQKSIKESIHVYFFFLGDPIFLSFNGLLDTSDLEFLNPADNGVIPSFFED